MVQQDLSVDVTVDNVITLTDRQMSGSLSRTSFGTLAGEQVESRNLAINQGTVAVSDPLIITPSYTSASLSITPAALTIAANAASKIYATNDPSLTYGTTGLANNVTVDGVTLTDTMSGSLTRTSFGILAGEQTGTFAINQGTCCGF